MQTILPRTFAINEADAGRGFGDKGRCTRKSPSSAHLCPTLSSGRGILLQGIPETLARSLPDVSKGRGAKAGEQEAGSRRGSVTLLCLSASGVLRLPSLGATQSSWTLGHSSSPSPFCPGATTPTHLCLSLGVSTSLFVPSLCNQPLL